MHQGQRRGQQEAEQGAEGGGHRHPQHEPAQGQLEPEAGHHAEAPHRGGDPLADGVGPGRGAVEGVGGGEEVAPGLEGVDDAGQGRHRLVPGPAAVVEEDDGPLRQLAQRPRHDRVGARTEPVVRVVGPPDGVEPEVGGQLVGPLLPVAGRGVAVAVGGAEQQRPPARLPLDDPGGAGDLQPGAPFGRPGQVGVGVGVVADDVAVVDLLAQELGVALGLLADDEERGRHVLPAQHVEDPGCPGRVGAVVEGQGHDARGPHPLDRPALVGGRMLDDGPGELGQCRGVALAQSRARSMHAMPEARACTC